MTDPLTLYRQAQLVFGDPDKRNLYTVPKFAGAHKKMLIVVADPDTDRIFVAHDGRFINGRIRSAKGQATHVVRDMLKKSQFKKDFIDGFISSLTEILHIDINKGNQFYSFIDAAIFNIAKQIQADKRARKAGRPPGTRTGEINK